MSVVTNQDRQLVDRILYLGSLASRRQDIDPLMDTLRVVTASWNPVQPLSASQDRQLKELEKKLKDYLVTLDPLRSFTYETLEKRLMEQAQGHIQFWKDSYWGTVIISVIVGCISFVLPLSLGLKDRALLSTFLGFVILHVGIARFYITALKNFKNQFRKVYVYLSAAAIVLSIAFAQYLIIELFDLSRFPQFRYAGIAWLFSIAFILMYLGFRMYAQMLQIKTRFTSLGVALSIAVGASILILVLPHHSVAEPLYFKISSVATGLLPVFSLLSASLAKKIKQTVTPAYAKSVNWLYYYTLVVGLGSILGQVAFHLLGELYGERSAVIMIVFGVAPQLVMLYASYLFKKETSK